MEIKMNIKKILVILLAAVIAMPLYAVNDNDITGSSSGEFIKVGAAGGQFLKIGIGARAMGMAGANSALVNDLTGIFWNPAGVADVKNFEATFAYTSWFAGFNQMFAAFNLPLGDFNLSAHFSRFGSSDIEITTFEEPNGTGTYYNVSDIVGGLTFSGYLTDRFSFGLTFKLVNLAFSDVSSSGIAFDIGTMYETGVAGIKIGFAIMNLGTEQSYSGTSLNSTKKLNDAYYQAPIDVSYLTYPFELPLTFRAGISSAFVDTDENKLVGEFDFITSSDVQEQYAIGLEYTWNNLLCLRGGYLFGQDQFGLAGGIGLKYISGGFDSSIDYSVNPINNFGLVHRISLNIGL